MVMIVFELIYNDKHSGDEDFDGPDDGTVM